MSLWEDQDEDVAVEYPAEFAFSPESLFVDVVTKYPALAGHFPTWFTSNYCTGVFIPSERVPEILAWIEKKIATFAKGDQRQFKGLLGILRAAVQKKLAYWEATDLAIPMMDQYAGDPRLMLASYLGNEPGTASSQVEEAPLSGHFRSLGSKTIDHWLISADYNPFLTNFWDISVWPPRLVHTLPEFAPHLAHSRDGRWLLFSETNSEARPRTFRPRLFSALNKAANGEFPVVVKGAEVSIKAGGFIGDRLMVFQDPHHSVKVGDNLPLPLWLEDKGWQPLPGLPTAVAKQSPLPRFIEAPVVGIVQLADGGDVVIWDGDGYEWVGEYFEKRFSMAAKTSNGDWTDAPAGSDGFFFLSNRQLFEVHRHGAAKAHAKRLSNIMSIGRGPAGSLLLKEGDNKDGDVAKLYFPGDGTFIHIEPELFDDEEYPFIYWSEKSDRFVVMAGKFLALRTSKVLGLPRYKATTGKRIEQ